MRYGQIVRLASVEEAENKFSLLKADGFDLAQVVYKPEVYTREDALAIRDAADKAGIEITAVFAGFRDSFTKWNIYSDYKDAGINSEEYGRGRVEYLKGAAGFVRDLGITDMLIHAGFVANDPFSREYLYMVEVLRDLASYVGSLGVNILLEVGGESPITLKRLIEDTGCANIYVNLDTANLIMYGYGNPVDAIYTLGEHIRSIHIKDGVPPTETKTLGKEVDFGTGFADFPKIIRMLTERGFRGPVIIEREIPDDRGRDEIIRTKAELDHIFANVG